MANGNEGRLAGRAASVCLSPYHFSHAFKVATGQTPRAYVTARRIEKAKECVADPDLPLAQIAHICGFADQPHFTALFGRHVGGRPRRLAAWPRLRGPAQRRGAFAGATAVIGTVTLTAGAASGSSSVVSPSPSALLRPSSASRRWRTTLRRRA